MSFITFVLLKYNCNYNDDTFSSFLLFVPTSTTTKDNHDSIWCATQPNTTTTKQSQHSNNKKHDVVWYIFNYQTDIIDDDIDNSSSINDD